MILGLDEEKMRDELIKAITAFLKAGTSDITVPILTYLMIKMFSSKATVETGFFDNYCQFDSRALKDSPTTLITTCFSLDKVFQVPLL